MEEALERFALVFPAGAGMNRPLRVRRRSSPPCSPQARGWDEPFDAAWAQDKGLCSAQARG